MPGPRAMPALLTPGSEMAPEPGLARNSDPGANCPASRLHRGPAQGRGWLPDQKTGTPVSLGCVRGTSHKAWHSTVSSISE